MSEADESPGPDTNPGTGTACVHLFSGRCRKYSHECDGIEDTNRCPEWQIVKALHTLAKTQSSLKYSKTVVLNMGEYESIHLSVSNADSFETANEELLDQAMSIDNSVGNKMKRHLAKEPEGVQ